MNSHQQPPNQQPDPIDQILTALARAAPPTGMDQRILHTLEIHATDAPESCLRARVHPRRKWVQRVAALAAEVPVRTTRSLSSRLTFASALTTAAILITLTILHHPRATNSPMPHLRDGLIVAKVGIGEADPPTEDQPRHMAGVQHTMRVPHVPLLGRGIPQPLPHPDTQPTLVSYPAPPMPLTAQEKLLLRIAHHDAPQALTPLTPAGRAAEQAQDKAAFQDFFPPPVPVEYPTLISQSNPPVAPTRTHGASK